MSLRDYIICIRARLGIEQAEPRGSRWIFAVALWVVIGCGLAPANAPAAVVSGGTAPITVPFDHLATGFELDGVHRDLPCESCHLNAVFKGTPRNCGVCHITGSVYNATPKNQTHIQSTNNCAQCHDTIAFRPDVHFDHAETLGTCVSCHNGTIAQGEGPTHPATSQACEACHTTMAWNPPKTVDHTQIPLAVAGYCIICHNGTSASGKPANHIATSLECGDCHLTTNWLGATFDHSGILTGCYSCHNGVKAVGKQGGHMPTTNSCENCHTTGIGTATPSWVPSGFDHTQMTVTTCATCHSGSVKLSAGGFVSGMPANHVPPVPALVDCAVCHGNTPAAETWTVLAADIPTLHQGLNVSNCVLCHGGETFAGVPTPYIPMSISGVSPTKKTPLAPPHIPILAGTDCSACHGAAYTAGGFGPATAMSAAKHAFVSTTCDTCHDTGKSYYVGSGTPLQLRPADHVSSTDPRMASGDCSLCHETTDWVSTTLPVGHMPNPANQSCAICHASAPGDYTPATLAALPVLHTGITGNCGQCHGNNVAALTWFNNYTPKDGLLTPNHIPYLSGTDCSSCHASTYATGGFGPMNMTQAKHAFTPPACNTCHEAGLSFYMGAANPALQGRPADHTVGQMVAPNDCSLCHTTANWNSNILPAGHMPNPGNQGCTVCHTNTPNDYTTATLAATPILHTGITGGCATCHGAFTALTWFNNFTPKDAVLSPAHIPYTSGTDCGSCHASTYAAGGFGPTNMSAAKHAFVPTVCTTCHEAGLSFYLGASTPSLQGRPADHVSSGDSQQQTGDCSLCHNTTDWSSNTLPIGHMPNPASQACAVCHTAINGTFASYATLGSVAVLHTGITGNCGQCHGSPSGALTFYNNNDNPKAAVLTPVHIPYLSGTDCSSCHASTFAAGGFGPTSMSAAKHAFVPTACDTCHEAGLSFYMGASTPALQGRPADHTANGGSEATSDCSACHSTTDWTASVLPAGHMPNPGNQTCAVCHTAIGTTLASYATLATIPVLHTGISGGCGQCHGSPSAGQLTFYNNNDNPKAAVLTPAHIPYSNGVDCSSCHATNYATGGFGPMNMTAATHAFVPTTCDTCHELGLTWYLGSSSTPLQTRPNSGMYDHIHSPSIPTMTTGDCSTCHVTSTWVATALPQGHMPNPAGQVCTVCHIAAPGNYGVFASTAILHTGITSGCAQCHGGTALSPFYNGILDPKSAASLSPAHIPAFNGEDCSNCHTTHYVTGGFGPMNMTQATHSGVGSTCNGCHEAGLSFYMGAASPGLQGRPADHTAGNQVAPNDCSLCHTTANWNSTALPSGHMPNPGNQQCNVCHTSAPTNYKVFAANSVLHTGIAGNCGQCHGAGTQLSFYNNDVVIKDNVLAPAHIPYISGVDCSSCHSSSTYAAGTFGPMNMTQATHAFVPGTCDTCHEAGLSFYLGAANPALQGRPADHTAGNQVSPNDCSLCHTTANWNSTSLPAGHMPNPANQACTVCHTSAPTNYKVFAANSVLHTGITGECSQCHGAGTQLSFYNNDMVVKDNVLSPAHIPYVAGTDCSSCHSSSTYAAGTFGPMNMTQATHAFVATTCDTCHGTATVSYYIGAANPGLQLRPADHSAGTMLTGDCSGCHTTANWNSTALPAGHMPNPGNQGCSVCHTSAPTSYTVFAANSVLHTGITGNCSQCHGAGTQLSFYNNDMVVKDNVLAPAHIPYLSGTDCSSCHSTTTYAAGAFGPMNMTQATHAFVATTCATCHGTATVSVYMGAASPGLQLRPADHTTGTMLTGDCSGCHTTANWNSTALPSNHMPNPANTVCSTCHTNSAAGDYTQATLAANAILHTGITSGCITCHGAPNATPPVYANSFTPKDAVLAPPHIPTSSTACEACHSTTVFTSFATVTMTQAMHTSMFAVIGSTCDGCHGVSSTSAFYPGSALKLQIRPSDHNSGSKATSDCSSCHSPRNWDSAQVRKTATAPAVATAKISAVAGAVAVAAPSAAAAAIAIPPAAVSHIGVIAGCAGCHNGVLAAGKGPTHVPSSAACENCHTTAAWIPARFDHSGVTAACVSCHNGVVAPGKPTRHIQTSQDCAACHGTIAWLPAVFNHTGVTAACQSCHNGVTATGKQPQHLVTTQDCGACHSILGWTTAGTGTPKTPLRPLLAAPKTNPQR